MFGPFVFLTLGDPLQVLKISCCFSFFFNANFVSVSAEPRAYSNLGKSLTAEPHFPLESFVIKSSKGVRIPYGITPSSKWNFGRGDQKA